MSSLKRKTCQSPFEQQMDALDSNKRTRHHALPLCDYNEKCGGRSPVVLEIQCKDRHLICPPCLLSLFETGNRAPGTPLVRTAYCPMCADPNNVLRTQFEILPDLSNVKTLHMRYATPALFL